MTDTDPDIATLQSRVDELETVINEFLVAYELQDDDRLRSAVERAEDLVRGPN